MKVQINGHPIYSDPRFKTERDILIALTEICGIDATIGVIDSYHEAPTLEIGIINESRNETGKMPSFIDNSCIRIELMKMGIEDGNPIQLPENISFDALQKIVIPLVIHWMKVAKFLVEYYQGELGKEMCLDGYKKWEEKYPLH